MSCFVHRSSVFLSIAQAIFANNLVVGLEELGLQGVDGPTISTTGLSDLTRGLSGEAKEAVLGVINNALTDSWRLPIVLTCISIVGALGVEHYKAVA
jgi:hypothetical protein